MHDLGALTVAGDAEFGGGALGEGLLDELFVGRRGVEVRRWFGLVWR